MSYVIGIDTGGTYTDAVLLDTEKKGVEAIVRKAKAFTTHEKLENGIEKSMGALNLTPDDTSQIEKVVLSTTLATNAIVEKKLHKVGLIVVGDMPRGEIASQYIESVPGRINIKGRALVNVSRKATEKALKRLLPHVGAIAISGAASVRNPMQEQEVKQIVQENCDLPVMCGHEFVSELGFLERTNTVAINAGLLPIINRFLEAIKNVLEKMKIDAPIFVVKGDGSIATEDLIREKPIETSLSGPATSMIGTINLTGIENAIVSDMGGTTTDTGIVRGKRVELSSEGAEVGDWRIKVKSAKLYTFGLGGDSEIAIDDGGLKVGPRRVLPACRGGAGNMTPTDLMHYTREFIAWDSELAEASVRAYASRMFVTPDTFVKAAEGAVTEKIYEENISLYKDLGFPVCAIGAPADTWYKKAKAEYEFDLIIPPNYEVANAVGAATAGIQETVQAIVRPGEEGHGFLVHADKERFSLMDRREALKKAYQASLEYAKQKILDQNLEIDQIETECVDVYMDAGRLIYKRIDLAEIEEEILEGEDHSGQFVETRIKVSANGKNFI